MVDDAQLLEPLQQARYPTLPQYPDATQVFACVQHELYVPAYLPVAPHFVLATQALGLPVQHVEKYAPHLALD